MQKFRGISPQRRTYHARDSYVQLAFNVRYNKRRGGGGVSALSPCVYLTSKVRGEYYFLTCEVRHTKTTHVTSTIKVRHKYLLRCIVRL